MTGSAAFTGVPAPGVGRGWWTVAGLASLSAHGMLAFWLLRAPPVVPADASPPMAIMIEMAAEPEAVATEELQISEDIEDADESAPAEAVEAPEEEPVDEVEEVREVAEQAIAEAEPSVEPVAELQPVETSEEDARPPMPDDLTTDELPERPSEVTLPPRRSAVEVPRAEQRERQAERAVPQRQQPRTQSRQRNRAQAPVRQTQRNAAQRSASGVARNVSPARWRARLIAHLERRKRYPSEARRQRRQGTAHVRFRIDRAGNVLSVRLVRSSGHAVLDREVVAMVRRASPVPAPPPGANRTITAPVRFRLR